MGGGFRLRKRMGTTGAVMPRADLCVPCVFLSVSVCVSWVYFYTFVQDE